MPDSQARLITGNDNVHQLWIHSDWFIPVDDEGQCVGICAEGALGFIIQLHNREHDDFHMALKIPRLMGETHRENGYIIEMLEKELKAVKRVHLGGSNPDSLLHAQVAMESVIRGPILVVKGSDEAKRLNESTIMVRFEKGKNPFFSLVKIDANITQFPDQANIPTKDKEVLEHLRELSKDPQSNSDWTRPLLIDVENSNPHPDEAKSVRVVPLDSALKAPNSKNIWYTCLPSIMYSWAPGTLQQSISLGLRGGKWPLQTHITMIERLLRGLDTLHALGMLHADIRPANVVYQDNPELPTSYYLSDYGSFAESGARAAELQPEDNTILGPVLAGERISAFYAPERSSAREREESDVAVLIHQGGTFIYVVLGWQTQLIDQSTGNPVASIQKFLEPEYLENATKRHSKLLAGDRVQIRDYVFDVLQEWNTAEAQIIKCHARYWKVYHGRIVVESDEPHHDIRWFPIPRSVELLQWSAATDLYSIGALTLYSVYRESEMSLVALPVSEKGEELALQSEDHHPEVARTELPRSGSELEEEFRIMLHYLASPPYFRVIWPELEWLRRAIEARLNRSNLTATDLASLSYIRHDEATLSEGRPIGDIDELHDGNNRTLLEATIDLVGRITQTAPGTRRLVTLFDHDLGRFVLFIHFVLCCLHRRNEISFTEDWMFSEERPFCESRIEQPASNGPAFRALKRIERLKVILTSRLLEGLKVPSEAIPEFDPRPDQTVRVELQALKKGNTEALQLINSGTEMLGKILLSTSSILGIKNALEQAQAVSRRLDKLSNVSEPDSISETSDNEASG